MLPFLLTLHPKAWPSMYPNSQPSSNPPHLQTQSDRNELKTQNPG